MVAHGRTRTGLVRRSRALAVALLAILGPTAVQAQTATLRGTVTDALGAGLPDVMVTVTAPSVAAPAVTVTGATGEYELNVPRPGEYLVTFERSGFATVARSPVRVASGPPRLLNVTLDVAAFAERVDVVGVTPLPGSALGRDRVAAIVPVIDAEDFAGRGAASMADAFHERLGSVTLEGTTTNPFQPTLRFRGFTASPLLGLPQGIAVYQNGVRVNEPFGDTVQFDLLPQFAVDRAQLSAGAEPTYGLNALGGALTLRLKNGFDHPGFLGALSGGSFGRLSGTVELGASQGAWALYTGVTRFDEDGWRPASPSEVTQAVADVAYRRDRFDSGVTVSYVDSRLNGNGPAPVDLLAVDRSSVFTYPDITENRLAFVQGRAGVQASSTWSLRLVGYYRDLDRRTLNGDEAEFGRCDDDVLPVGAPDGTLCLGTGSDEGDEAGTDPDVLVDVRTGRFITDGDALGDGALNRTATRTAGYGAALEATATTRTGDRQNVLMLGSSADFADVDFAFEAEVGTLTGDRGVAGSGVFAGVFGQAPDDQFNTDIRAENRALGLYARDTFSPSDRVHLTVSGRYNAARIAVADQLGTSLDGTHAFTRFNPEVGAVFLTSDSVSVFGRYAESNRAPTAAELSCADPAEPCRIPNAFVSDPPLAQAVARSIEGGVRGRRTTDGSNLEWAVAVYRTRIDDDILFVASPDLIGTGFFQNAGDTQRVGVDVDLTGRVAWLDWYASYGLVHATFESPLELPGNEEVNDAAAHGVLAVEPGDRLAGIPRHSFKAGIRQMLTDDWDVTVETIVASSRVFVGDEGNDQPALPGYGIANLRSAYRLGRGVELFLRVDNVFGAEYDTFGVLAALEIDLSEAPGADDPRFAAPGAPRSAFTGLRVRF